MSNEDDDRARHEKADALARAYLPSASALLTVRDPEFLVEGLIPKAGITLIAGEPGATKSWLAYDLLRAAALGVPWLGRSKRVEPVTVALCNYDNPDGEVKRRFLRMGLPLDTRVRVCSAGTTNPPPDWPDVLRLPADKTNKGPELDALGEALDSANVKLVVFDSFRQAHTGNENDSQQMGMVMSGLRSLTREGVTVVILHHTSLSSENRNWNTKARGSGEITAQCDAVVEVVSGDAKGGIAKWTKSRGWNMGDARVVKYKLIDEDESTRVEAFGRVLPGVTQAEDELYVLSGALRAVLAQRPCALTEIMGALKMGTRQAKAAVAVGVDAGWIEAVRGHNFRGFGLRDAKVPNTCRKGKQA